MKILTYLFFTSCFWISCMLYGSSIGTSWRCKWNVVMVFEFFSHKEEACFSGWVGITREKRSVLGDFMLALLFLESYDLSESQQKAIMWLLTWYVQRLFDISFNKIKSKFFFLRRGSSNKNVEYLHWKPKSICKVLCHRIYFIKIWLYFVHEISKKFEVYQKSFSKVWSTIFSNFLIVSKFKLISSTAITYTYTSEKKYFTISFISLYFCPKHNSLKY